MNDIIKKLVEILLTKDHLKDVFNVSFTANLNNKIHDFKRVTFNEESANIIFKILDDEIVNSFNLTIINKLEDYPLGWYQSKYIFHGEGDCNSLYECLSGVLGFRLDDYERSIKNSTITLENLSEHIDLLIQFDLMLNEHRKSIFNHLEKINNL